MKAGVSEVYAGIQMRALGAMGNIRIDLEPSERLVSVGRASILCSLLASTINPSPYMAENDSYNANHHIIHERLIALASFKESASPCR